MYKNSHDDIPFWIECPPDQIPKGALRAGTFNGEPVYIGRAQHNRALTPGSVLASRHSLFLPWGFQTHQVESFDILMGGSTVNWVAGSKGNVPINAFVGGYSQDMESLFIARVKHGDNVVVGKIHQQYNLSYVPDIDGGKELECDQYEVLVV